MAERYLPLYRKYRPQTFKDLIGQENIVKALSNAINLNKISHAYLLCGPRGTGKTTTARIIAKSLNCLNGPTLEPCGECPSCKDILNSTPIDVIEIDAASNRKVEDARNILEKIQFVPVNGHFKIYIIDEVHMLTTEAFNTLLKTLEEPPENVVFILATTEPHKVLDTIISRCQRFDFRRITTEDIVARLKYISHQEKINISEEALYTIARSSQGGMRDSLALLDQISVIDVDKEISSEDVNEMLGRLSFDILNELSETLLNANTQDALVLLDRIYNKGNEPFQIVSNLIQYFRNMLVVKSCSDRKIAVELTQQSEANILTLREQSEKIASEQILYTIERLSFYSKEIKETTNRYLWLELCIMELASNIKFASYTNLIERIEKLEGALASGTPVSLGPVPIQNNVGVVLPKINNMVESSKIEYTEVKSEPVVTITENVAEPSIKETVDNSVVSQSIPKIVQTNASDNGGDLMTAWQGILQNIESMPSRMFFYNLSRPVSITSDEIVITFAKDIFVKQAKEDSKHLPLKKAALAYYGKDDIKVSVKLSSPTDDAMSIPKPALAKLEKKVEPPKLANSDEENDNEEFLKEAMAPTNDEISSNKQEDDYNSVLSDQSRMVVDLFNGKVID